MTSDQPSSNLPSTGSPSGRAPSTPIPLKEASQRLLRLLAMDDDDLAILSANLQDMHVKVGELLYLPEKKRFALAGKRYDWIAAAGGGCQRCATGLHFEFVRSVTRVGFDQAKADQVLNLLAINFEPQDPPAGMVTLTFSGGAAIRLKVECLEAQMRDLGERWPCDCPPAHPLDEAQPKG